MSYLHGLYLDSFQTTKRHSYDGYSIYISIFNSFLQGVYPVGVTDLRLYFTHIIGHNSVNVHRIPTKGGTESALMSPSSVPNFSPIGVRIRVLWRILRNEDEEKHEEIKMKLCSLVSQKWLERFSSNLVCRLP